MNNSKCCCEKDHHGVNESCMIHEDALAMMLESKLDDSSSTIF